ncbi:SGNH/GDSL hydrolase family protein [Candidatus Pantoea multigeneris]|nr:SGNH/GDSL hydrolase family protein [Pantoea multigeneris]
MKTHALRNSLMVFFLTLFSLKSFGEARTDKFIIEAWGGSSTKGVIAIRENGRLKNIVTPDNEIAWLNRLLQQKYGPDIEVVNRGEPSAQAVELLHGTYKYKNSPPWATSMSGSTANVVLLNFATNDARHYHFTDTAADYVISPDQYRQVMTQLIRLAENQGKKVVLQEPHPLCGRAVKWDIAPYVQQLDSLARAQHIPLVAQYQRIKAMPDWQSLMSPDCIHPSVAMYRNKAEATFAVLIAHFGPQMAAFQQASEQRRARHEIAVTGTASQPE